MRKVTLSMWLAWAYIGIWTNKFGIVPPIDIFFTLSVGCLIWLHFGTHRQQNALVISCAPFILLSLSVEKFPVWITTSFIAISFLLYHTASNKMDKLFSKIGFKIKTLKFMKSKKEIFYRDMFWDRYKSTRFYSDIDDKDDVVLYKGRDFVLLNKEYEESIKPKEGWTLMEGKKIFKMMKAGAITKEDIVLESI